MCFGRLVEQFHRGYIFRISVSTVARGLPGASASVSQEGGSSCGKCLFNLITTLKRGRNSGPEEFNGWPFSYLICKQTVYPSVAHLALWLHLEK